MRLGVRVCLSPIANGGSGPGTGMVTGGPMVALGNGMVPGDPWGQAPGHQAPGHHIETVMDFARLLKRFCALPPARIICIKLHYNMMQSYLKLVRQEKSTVFRIGDEIINNRASLGCLWNSIQAWLLPMLENTPTVFVWADRWCFHSPTDWVKWDCSRLRSSAERSFHGLRSRAIPHRRSPTGQPHCS